MIAKRIIPLFLLKGKRLVKGTNFKDFIDVGDPTSQGMIYDAQGADEIIIVDIEATDQNRIIDPKIINDMIHKCRLPIAAGGGIRDINSARECFAAGADKIVVNTHAVLESDFINQLAREFGSQSIVVSIDVKKSDSSEYNIYINSGRQKTDLKLRPFIKKIIASGAGELIVTSIDKEGTLSGLDYELYKNIRDFVSVPLIASGGVGCYDDMVKLFRETNCDATAIGKMLFLRDYDIVRIKSYIKGKKIMVREA